MNPRVVAALAATLLLLWQPLLPAADKQQTQQQINKLQADIRALEKRLRSAKGEQQQLNDALRKAEKEGGRLSRLVKQNRHQIEQHKQQLGELQRQQQQLQSERDQQLQALSDEIAAAYRTGRQDRLRLLLNQQQPERITRLLRYHQYYSEHRTEAVNQLDQTLNELTRVEQQLGKRQQALQAEQKQLAASSNKLTQSRQARQQALTSLTKKISGQTQSLKRLKTDQQRLKQVLKELQQTLALNELKVSTQAFAKLKGKLPWPTNRKRVLRAYGSRNSQGVRRDGILVGARTGDSVKAIHHGRVVFSDWLRGYGLLLILDHGDDYMSLYAHNQSLVREVGDWIASGEQVATVGDSGGQGSAGLYFAIRHQGNPVDPILWLKRR
ncbi:murein hydrolase activator EnvC family protein [Motiliproteus sp.]|uniref:murein hydrolase activator EnvC family protein n=1 Tax=Motiliproteus sp. TaxID=1898955 RepID=UPI003BA8F190